MSDADVLETILRAAPLGLVEYDREGRYVRVNDVLGEINGRAPADHVGLRPSDVVPDRGAAIEEHVQRILAGQPGAPLVFRAEIPVGSGRMRWMESQYQPIRDAGGEITGVLGVVVEATEREQAAALLRSSEERYRTILETVVDGVVTIDADGTIHSANGRVEAQFGYAVDELTGENVVLLMPEDQRDAHRTGLARYLVTGEGPVIGRTVRVEGRRRDGSRFPLSLSVNEMWLDDRRMFTGVLRDVTDEVRAESALREAGAGLERIVALAPRFHRGGSPEQVAGAICHAAVESFGADAASLWQLGADEFAMVRRVPSSEKLAPGTSLALSDVADFRARMAGGQAWFVPDLEAESPDGMARFGRQLGSVAQLRVPLSSPDAIPDALLLLSWRSAIETPSAVTLALAQRFGDLASLALVEAHRREAQQAVERLYARFGESLLPRPSVSDPSLRCLVRYLPGEARLQLGGDFVDAVERPDGTVALLIGDVAGHGPNAAALGAGLRAAWRGLSLADASLTATLAGLNAVVLREDDAESFATVGCALIAADRRSVTVVSAGHPPPVLLTDRIGVPVVPIGVPLGIDERAAWEPVAVALPDRWELLLYTDGLVEGRAAPASDERYGPARLLERLGAEPVPAAIGDAAVDRVIADVAASHGGALPDDIAILLVGVPDDA